MHDQNSDNAGRIVVGVDGSEGSKTALRWAMAQARLTGATVEAVNSWQDPMVFGYSYGWNPAPFEGERFAAVMSKLLDDTIADVSAQLEAPVTVLARVVQGHPAQALMEAANGAQLLVVGSRGHGTFAGIVLGSVSQHCVQHASCPVAVVPAQ
jgi:nucleotide-binding universal stress UspA family protein